MTLTIKLFATFQQGRFAVERREYELGPTVKGIVEDLAIPEAQIGVLLVNSRHVELDRVLSDGDVLAIFPVIGGG